MQKAIVAGIVLTAPLPALANETVLWHRQALGQSWVCPIRGTTWNWPNNNNWSQAQIIGDPCSEGASVIEQPSNWSSTNYPNGLTYDVVLGSWGGAPANLNLGVTVNSLTIQSDGGLNMQWGSSITANTYDLQGDSGVSMGGGGGGTPTLTVAQGGTLIKSAGAGTFAFPPSLVLRSSSGTFTVASGSLALPGGGSSYSNCTFTVSSGMYLYQVPPG